MNTRQEYLTFPSGQLIFPSQHTQPIFHSSASSQWTMIDAVRLNALLRATPSCIIWYSTGKTSRPAQKMRHLVFLDDEKLISNKRACFYDACCKHWMGAHSRERPCYCIVPKRECANNHSVAVAIGLMRTTVVLPSWLSCTLHGRFFRSPETMQQ